MALLDRAFRQMGGFMIQVLNEQDSTLKITVEPSLVQVTVTTLEMVQTQQGSP